MISSYQIRNTLNRIVTTGLLLTIVLVTAVLLNVIQEVKENGFNLSQLFPTKSPSNTSWVGTLATQNNSWFPVPAWLAGTWQAKSQLLLDSYDYRRHAHVLDGPMQIATNRESVIGTQQDNLGRIWYYAGTPYTRKIETGEFVDFQQMEKISLVHAAPAEVKVASLATVTRVNKSDNQIVQVFKEQTITTYSPLNDQLVRAQYLINDFDLAGAPISASQACCTQSRTNDFQQIDSDERGNLKYRFEQYLVQHGLANLVAFK